MSIRYYDRGGAPMTQNEWLALIRDWAIRLYGLDTGRQLFREALFTRRDRHNGPPHVYTPGVQPPAHQPHVWWYQRYVCAAGHRFTGQPPPGIIKCPTCGTEDLTMDQEQP